MDPPACPEIADSQAVRAMSVLLAGLDLLEREELVDSLALQVVPVSLELRAPRAIPERRVSMAVAAAQFLNYFSDHKSVFSFIRRLPTCHCQGGYIFYAGASLAGAGYCRQCRWRPAILPLQLRQGCQVCVKISAQRLPRVAQFNAVSYTHLTLPTKRIV